MRPYLLREDLACGVLEIDCETSPREQHTQKMLMVARTMDLAMGSLRPCVLAFALAFVLMPTGMAVQSTGDFESPVRRSVSEPRHIEFGDGALASSSPQQTIPPAARSISDTREDGETRFRPIAGQLVTSDVAYAPGQAQVHLDGASTASAEPIQSTPVPAPPAPFYASHGQVLMMGGALLGTGYAAWRHGQRRAPPDQPHRTPIEMGLSPGSPTRRGARIATSDPLSCYLECERMAEREGDFAAALACIQAARQVEPRNATFAATEGGYYKIRGDLERALACYDEAAYLSDSGEPEIEAAAIALKLGHLEEALVYVERGLEKAPHLMEILLCEDEFRTLHVLERFQAAAARAERRLRYVRR